MKDKKKPLPPAWRNAIERLDRAFEENAPANYSELIDIFARAHFGDLWVNRPRNQDDSQTN